MLTEGDEELMLGEIELLYTELYEPYEGFREAKTMVDERILTRFDKLRMETKVETEAATKAEVARNLLKAGVARDIILQATGLTITDIENQVNTVSSAPR
jgi:predicted transposase/invertase (TIGR01784 family)